MLRRSARRKESDQAVPDAPTTPQKAISVAKKRPKRVPAVESNAEATASKPTSEVKPSQRKRGKLRFITEMPLDILFEIFSHVFPVDLLNASRSSKALRDILLRKSVAFIWKQAYLNLNHSPPPCPDDLNEAQYANLLWGTRCFFCGVPSTVVAWQCRVRTCRDCIYTSKFTSIFSPDNPLVNNFKKAALACSTWWYSPPSRAGGSKYICVTSDLEAIRKRLDELDEAKADTLEFVTQCNQIIARKQEHSVLCRTWESIQRDNRKHERKDARDNRKTAILAKLKALGWSDELSKGHTMSIFVGLPAVKQNKELTERIWTNIQPELVAFLEEVKRQRLQSARIVVLRARISTLAAVAQNQLSAMPISEVRPSINDVCAMPEYRAILEFPSDTIITKKHFVELLANLPGQTDQWRKSNTELLLKLLPKQKGNKKLDTSRLDLCTTFFRCHSCREPISYPRILSHACLLKGPEKSEEEVDVLFQACRQAPWVHGQETIVFDTEASDITTMLIKMCGRDPKIMTSSAMDELDSRFECLRCAHPRQGRLVMKWRIALLHELEEHYGETVNATSWELLGADDVIAAKEQEVKTKKRPPPDLLCVKCNNWTTYTHAQIQKHLISQHAMDSVEDNAIRNLDATIRMHPGAVRINDVESV
ncbi:hypothetical protein C8R44DRAFT_26521 [Mycena epipterygia]|nr:hypothetical protein C8R44DRAFT_26521 [Mycena epipterygia]